MTIAAGRLWLAAGNIVSPASYDLVTGEYLGHMPHDDTPQSNHGRETGIFNNRYIIFGGTLHYSQRDRIATDASFDYFELGEEPEVWDNTHVVSVDGVFRFAPGTESIDPGVFCRGIVPPVWDESRTVVIEHPYKLPSCYLSGGFEEFLDRGGRKNKKGRLGYGNLNSISKLPEPDWIQKKPDNSSTVSLALAKNAVVGVYLSQPGDGNPRRSLVCMNPHNGAILWQHRLSGSALPGGLLIDREGSVVVVMEDGSIVSYSE